jgi:hypothetical protein
MSAHAPHVFSIDHEPTLVGWPPGSSDELAEKCLADNCRDGGSHLHDVERNSTAVDVDDDELMPIVGDRSSGRRDALDPHLLRGAAGDVPVKIGGTIGGLC